MKKRKQNKEKHSCAECVVTALSRTQAIHAVEVHTRTPLAKRLFVGNKKMERKEYTQ